MGVTKLHANRHVGRDEVLLAYEFTPALTTVVTDAETKLDGIGANAIVVDAWVDTITAEAGATSSKLDIAFAHDKDATAGTGEVMTATADNGGALGRDTGTFTVTPTGANEGEDLSLFARYTQVGTASTKPVYRIYVRVLRTGV